MKKTLNWVLAATLISGFTMSVTSCQDNDDNPAPAKKQYRLVQNKQVYDTSDAYYIADYTYDDQGRLASFVRVGYNTKFSDGPWVDADYSYTYGDHYIIETLHNDNSYYYYTLNDDGLIVKAEGFVIEDGVEDPRSLYYFHYKDGRLQSVENTNPSQLTVLNYVDDDLMSYGDVGKSAKEFTRSGLSVDHGYLNVPMSGINDRLYMMGYYGKPSRHLESREKLESVGATIYSLFDSEYTYTIADGHIVEMVEVTNTVMKSPVYNTSGTKTTTTTFTYEEY